MIDADKAEQGKESEIPLDPASAEPANDRGRSRLVTSAFVVALVWTVMLLVFVVVKTSVASTVLATLGSAVAMVTAIIGVFERSKFPAVGRKVARGVVAAILIADVVVSGGWAGWSYHRASRTIDVLSTVTLGQNIDVLPEGHATLDVAVPAQKDTIALVFQVVDHNPGIGSCAPNTSLSVTPSTAGNRGVTFSAISGVQTVVDLPAGITKLHVDIAVTNTRGDQNCGVDLSVVSAKLQNK